MPDVKAKAKREKVLTGRAPRLANETPKTAPPADNDSDIAHPGHRILRRTIAVLITVASVACAAATGQSMWRAYVEAPWTRDATVRAYVVTMAPEVAGRTSALHQGL